MSPVPDDHPDKWVYKGHTRAKHFVLSYYLDVWAKIVSDPNYEIRLFDCFAGRGDYHRSDGSKPIQLEHISADVDYPGSPLIMLDSIANHNHRFRGAECYFLEPIDGNRSELGENLNSIEGLPENINWNIESDPFQDGILEIIRNNGGWDGFAFFFMDPFGLKHLDYDIVSQICGTSRFDCILTLMTKELIRWQDSPDHAEAFQTLYGTHDWKNELENFDPKHLETAEAEYYCNRLEEGGVEYTLSYMTTREDTRELMYDLICTTNDEKGITAMKESITRCGTDYALAYAPKRPDIGGLEQTKITGGEVLTAEMRAKSYLCSRFAGQTISFDELIEKLFQDPDRLYDRPLTKDYRKYLRELDNAGEVDVRGRESPEDPLNGGYLIDFPSAEDA